MIRVGVFNAISGGQLPALGPRGAQARRSCRDSPPPATSSTVKDFEEAQAGLATLAIDPSRGSILSLLVETPSSRERIEQGGPIGYAIIVLGILAGAGRPGPLRHRLR